MAKIWVVEDDDVAAQLAADLLAVHGHEVVRYGGGQRVIDDLLAGSVPDLMVLDMKMPAPDGHDVLGVVKRLGVPKVVALTSAPGALENDVKSLCRGVLCKPFLFGDLLETVASALGTGAK